MDAFWKFLNSSFFIAIVTLAAGMVAYWLYKKKNRDFKKDAANIILLEVQNAERLIAVAKDRMQKDGVLVDNAYVLPTESWSKYKYMFVRDFDRDQWDSINIFYNRCHWYDEAVRHKTAFFKENERTIRSNMQRITADYMKQLMDGGDTPARRADTQQKIDAFQDAYLNLRSDLTQYNPQKPSTDAKVLLESINESLSQTAIGSQLKRLAGI